MKTVFKQFLLAGSILAVLSSSALATGGFSCEVDDKNLKLDVSSALGSGMGAPIINLKAESIVKLKGTPSDLVKLDLSKSLVHSWMDSPDLRLYFYSEREGNGPHGYVEIIITAKYVGDEGEAKGNYRLTAFYTEPTADKTEGTSLKAKGKVSCSVE